MYDNDFSKETDRFILSLLTTTKNHFIYFNYLRRGDQTNKELETFLNTNIERVRVIPINSKAMSGQNRSTNITEVEEVICTNVNPVGT